MENQEKILKGLMDFAKWLLPKAKDFGLENSPSVKAMAEAQKPEDLINGINALEKEIGKEKFEMLAKTWGESQQQMFREGGKIDAVINKLQRGGYAYYRWIMDKPVYKGGRKYSNGEELYRQDDSGYYYRNISDGKDTTLIYRPNVGEVYELEARPEYRTGNYNDIYGQMKKLNPEELSKIIKLVNNKIDMIDKNKTGGKLQYLANKCK